MICPTCNESHERMTEAGFSHHTTYVAICKNGHVYWSSNHSQDCHVCQTIIDQMAEELSEDFGVDEKLDAE